MEINQRKTPIYDQVLELAKKQPYSLHVPGHKNGRVFNEIGYEHFKEVLRFDLTELPGLDDLHAPEGMIKDAQQLAANWFGAMETFFLVNGSTVGNLAMIMATCQSGDMVLVQRNCHKSILHGLELAGVRPVFLAPEFDHDTERYDHPSLKTLENASELYPEAKALILTYPDYFGKTFELKQMIEKAHQRNMVVLIDEAHGCHFSIPYLSSPSAVSLGADIVVQSAHKMTPALTMGAFLHVNKTERVDVHRLQYYLQMLQSSSPSYLIMISLDLARHYLANYKREQFYQLMRYMGEAREIFATNDFWRLEEQEEMDDPLKCVWKINPSLTPAMVAEICQSEGLIPELVTEQDILFIFGLEPTIPVRSLKNTIKKIKDRLKLLTNHDRIETNNRFIPYRTNELALSYQEMKERDSKWVKLENTIGYIAAEAIVPYPPGIPLLVKGEYITDEHVQQIHTLQANHILFQPSNVLDGLYVFEKEKKDQSEGE